jgi:hypothetical protein
MREGAAPHLRPDGAERIAAATTTGRLVRLPGLTMARVVGAILSVLPIDDFEPAPLRRMQVVDDPSMVPPVQAEASALISAGQGEASDTPGSTDLPFTRRQPDHSRSCKSGIRAPMDVSSSATGRVGEIGSSSLIATLHDCRLRR